MYYSPMMMDNPKPVTFTSLTTLGFNLISFGRAAMISDLLRPLRTGMRNLTSETRLAYKFLTLVTNSALGKAMQNWK